MLAARYCPRHLAPARPSRGAFEFSVGEPGANPYAGVLTSGEIGTSTPLGLVLQALAHWVHFAGLALMFGLAAYAMLTRHGSFSRWIGVGVVLLVAAEPLAVLAQLASLTFDGDRTAGLEAIANPDAIDALDAEVLE